jgi:hypothetical protein
VNRTRAFILGLAVLAGAVPAAALAFVHASPNGIGRMTVGPTTLIAGTPHNELTFTFIADRSPLHGATQVEFPRGWSPPQGTHPGSPGYVEVKAGQCDRSTRIIGVKTRRVTIATSCGRRRSYQLLYHDVTAPVLAADGYIFIVKTRSSAGGRNAKLRPLGRLKQPVVKVRGGPAAALFVGSPSVITAGTAFSVTVRAIDAYGNNAYPYAATVQLASTDPAASIPAPYTYGPTDAAQHVFPGAILRTVGTQQISATDSNGLVAQSTPITVVQPS